MVRRDRLNPLVYTVMAPLFRPENLKDHWRVIEPANKDLPLLVLALNSGRGQSPGVPMTEDFLSEYSRILSTGRVHQANAYEAGKAYAVDRGLL